MIILTVWHWFQNTTGTHITPQQLMNGGSKEYNFWSGFGSDITELALVVGLLGLYHRHNCAVPKCPRLARKHWEVKGTPLRTCHHHATKPWHALLLKEYKRDHKEQHALYNQ